MNNVKMLYYDRIDVFKDVDVNKTSKSKACNIFHYWYFLNKGFTFEPNVCNGYQYALVMSMNLNDIAILKVRGIDYCSITNGIRKNGTMGLLRNSSLNQKRGTFNR